jgi:hypothetical protein
MKYALILFSLAVLALAFPMPAAAQPPAPNSELWFLIQQDTRQAMDQLRFTEGLQKLLAGLPPDTGIRVYLFRGNDYTLVWQGAAGRAVWPMPGLEFSLANPSTTPYKNLLRLLNTEAVQDRRIVFVSNGISQDMLIRNDDENTFLKMPDTFTPSRYPPLDQVVKYCRTHNVTLYGFFVGLKPPARGDLSDISFSMFRYVVEESKGKSYYNYNTFIGVFETLLKEGTLTQ